MNDRESAQNVRGENSNEAWRLSFVLENLTARVEKMGEIQDKIVDRLNGDQGLSSRVQRVEDKADAMHVDFNAFAKQQQLNHEQNREEAKAAREFRRRLMIAAVPLVPTVIGGITWLVWRSVEIFQVHHL